MLCLFGKSLLSVSLLLPFACMAASGSWSDSHSGVNLQNRGVAATSPPLRAPANSVVTQSAGHTITSISWRIQFLTAQPAGIQFKLCTESNDCAYLEGAVGETRAFYGKPAQSTFFLTYFVQGKGALYPPLRVVSNQLMVNYQ
ncbi:flagellar protein FlhE [Rouxiella sp. Mn2063]|uniref:flagellar protein FlhE n=1 Tax=Rouxiella sp. Mn2063 TaxID=3395262 RepID=UPI003BEBE27A